MSASLLSATTTQKDEETTPEFEADNLSSQSEDVPVARINSTSLGQSSLNVEISSRIVGPDVSNTNPKDLKNIGVCTTKNDTFSDILGLYSENNETHFMNTKEADDNTGKLNTHLGITIEREDPHTSKEIQVRSLSSESGVNLTDHDKTEAGIVTTTQRSTSSLEYKFENMCQITGSWKEFTSKDNVCLKGCKWSPDGTCILTNSDDNILRLFDLPKELHCQESWEKNKVLPELQPALRVQEGGLIYDYCWYPLMSSYNPLSCCMVSTSKESPIHLWDAFTGELRCTYRSYNAVDEVESAHSLAFSPSGEKLYCGFRNFIRIFDTNIPGRTCISRNLKRTPCPTQKQLGIISCICINPAMPDIYVAGSYNRSIGVYVEPEGTLLCLLHGQSGGVTHLQFSPDGTKLFSGGRKDPEIICWDLRNPGNILFTIQREVTTNQRIYFDITADSRYFISGNTNGKVSVWDTLQEVSCTIIGEPTLSQCFPITAHSDCVNGVSVHQQYPILATASGQRHVSCSGSESDSSTENDFQDTSLKFWWVGNIVSSS